ncbi:hypothetical protein [Methylobacterium oryzae]|uniref:hypothetical protein n=1 Tax=Methylobacterium oryzae TaxID=334852 RepID=UPI002F2D70D3
MSDLTTPRYLDASETAGFPDILDDSDIEQVRMDTLSRWMDAERESWAARCLMAIASGVTTLALVEAEMKAHDDRRAALVAAGKMDRFGNRFFEVGDLVTRDGTDIHRVVSHNGSGSHAPDGFTVVCVKAPADGWTEVGETEFNVCRRYDWVEVPSAAPRRTRDADLPAVGTFG